MTDKFQFKGNRNFFIVPAGLGALLSAAALMFLVFGLMDPYSSRSVGARDELSGWFYASILLGFCATAAFKVVHSTYIDCIRMDESGIFIKKIPFAEIHHPWPTIKKIFSDERALCIQLLDGTNIDVNSCFLDFPGLREALSSQHKLRKQQ